MVVVMTPLMGFSYLRTIESVAGGALGNYAPEK